MKKGLKIIFVLAIIFISTFSLTFKTKADSTYYQNNVNEYISFRIYDYTNYFRFYLIALDNYINIDTTNKIYIQGAEEFGTNDNMYPPLTFITQIDELTTEGNENNYNYYYFDILKNFLTNNYTNIFITFNDITYVDSATTQIENEISFSVTIPYATYQKGYEAGYENGYDIGRREEAIEGYPSAYQEGYDKCQLDLLNAITPQSYMNKVMNTVTSFLNIQILPSVTIGGIILIPLALNLVIIIIKILKKH